MPENAIKALTDMRPGAIEVVLSNLRSKIENVPGERRENEKERERDEREREIEEKERKKEREREREKKRKEERKREGKKGKESKVGF